jgi:hypothetical protein
MSEGEDTGQSSGVAHTDDLYTSSQPITGEIYLYGENHGVEAILNKELELWNEYYHNNGFKHLFIELGYCYAEYLNLWMQSDDDEILEMLYDDWRGSLLYKPCVKEFYRNIKEKCPETIFHGIDVEQWYNSSVDVESRYLNYLRENGLDNSEQFQSAVDAIKQGKEYNTYHNEVYRENMLTENFIREFDKLDGESVVGFFGEAHTILDGMDRVTNSVPCMANQLVTHYGDIVHSEDLSWMALLIEPDSVDVIEINGKEYLASCFGEQDITGMRDLSRRVFWRIESAYEDFKDMPKTGNVLPYNNYPMLIEEGQVFMIDYYKTDGSSFREYLRSDGYIWNDLPSTEEFVIE